MHVPCQQLLARGRVPAPNSKLRQALGSVQVLCCEQGSSATPACTVLQLGVSPLSRRAAPAGIPVAPYNGLLSLLQHFNCQSLVTPSGPCQEPTRTDLGLHDRFLGSPKSVGVMVVGKLPGMQVHDHKESSGSIALRCCYAVFVDAGLLLAVQSVCSYMLGGQT